MVDKVEVSLVEEMENVARALQRVTSAIFAGSPGTVARIPGKRKSAQFTFKINDGNKKRSIQSTANRKIAAIVFKQQALRLESEIRKALRNVVAGLTGMSNTSVSVMGRNLGSVRSSRPIDSQPFASYIRSPAGAGEIGLPDPEESLRNLKIALFACISVDVVVRSDGPQVKFSFDQRKLLKLTPHPDTMEGGPQGAFHSWLSLVTGPDMVRSIPGFSLVRARDIKFQLESVQQRLGKLKRVSTRSLKPVQALSNLLKISRTRSNAGDLAGLMLNNRRRNGHRSTAQFAGGATGDYHPSKSFDGFWDEWWFSIKQDLGVWSRRIMFAAIRGALKR